MSEDGSAAEKSREVGVRRYQNEETSDGLDMVCVEEPLEIMINDEPYYMTMRLPGQDMFLAVGLCFSEGVISSFGDVQSVNHCIDSTNRINVYLTPERRVRTGPAKKRRTIASSCGLCGKELLSDICTVVTRSARTMTVEFSRSFSCRTASNRSSRFSTPLEGPIWPVSLTAGAGSSPQPRMWGATTRSTKS